MTKINPSQTTSDKPNFGGRYYVYALIDPESNKPFYIGKGEGRRLMAHFSRPLSINHANGESIGLSTQAMLDAKDDDAASESRKQSRIRKLKEDGYDHTAIARVIARLVDEQVALAIEACLIKSVYGASTLTNQLAGHHPERFRDKDNWKRIDGFDWNTDASIFNGPASNGKCRHYVYVLRDPDSGEVFYVGKGTGKRISKHEFEAINRPGQKNIKLERIRELLAAGKKYEEIARVLAWVETEMQADAIETLYMKFVFCPKTLSNNQQGRSAGLFRAHGDWEARKGFDLPFVMERGYPSDRQDDLDTMLGLGLDAPLLEVARLLEDEAQLNFCKPIIMDSGELGLKASVDGKVDLKIFVRHQGRFQVELRPNSTTQKVWMLAKFSSSGFNAPSAIRSDGVYFPVPWRGSKNMTPDIREIVSRALFLIRVAKAENLDCFEPREKDLIVKQRPQKRQAHIQKQK